MYVPCFPGVHVSGLTVSIISSSTHRMCTDRWELFIPVSSPSNPTRVAIFNSAGDKIG